MITAIHEDERAVILTDNALYYTFSTIAQALAGVFAVLAAFALFRLTRLERDVADGKDLLDRIGIASHDLTWPVLRDSGNAGLVEFGKKNDWSIPSHNSTLEAGHAAWGLWKTLALRLRIALAATSADIGL